MTLSEHLSKLLKKAHIVLDEQADILNPPLDHREAINPHTEGKARDLVRRKYIITAHFAE